MILCSFLIDVYAYHNIWATTMGFYAFKIDEQRKVKLVQTF